MKKTISVLLVIFILLPIFSANAMSLEETTVEQSADDSSEQEESNPLLHLFLEKMFRLGYYPKAYFGRYFYKQDRPPTPIQSSVGAVTLKYNEKTYFDLGGIDPDTGDWQKMVVLANTYSWGWMYKKMAYSFEVVPFENSSMDVWNIEFDPPIVELYPNRVNFNWAGAFAPLKTNVSIMLKSNDVDPSIFTQDIVLKINIWREEALDKSGLLRGTPKYVFTDYDEYIEKETELNPYKPPYFANKFYKFYQKYSIIGPYLLWKSNKKYPTYDKFVDSVVEVLIKVDKYHLAELKAPETVEIQPYEVKSIPVSIINRGSHIDTFNFNVTCDNEEVTVVPPPALTIKPGEKGEALVGVAAPKTIYALGDISSISVGAYSVDDPETVFANTVTLQTAGVYATGAPTINIFLVIIAVIILLVILRYILLNLKNKNITKKGKLKTKAKKQQKK